MDSQFDLTKITWVKGNHGMPEAHYIFKIPSVTGIINDMIADPDYDEFVKNVGKEKAEQIMNSAGQRGSATHSFIENFLSKYSETKDVSEALKYTQETSPRNLIKEEIPIDKIQEGRDLFYKFYYSDYPNQFSDILAMELAIYSPSYFYRGKLDIFYKHKLFGLAVTDLKSSNGKIKQGSAKEYKYKLQLGGYANCIDEMYVEKKINVNYASILCIDKQTEILQEISSSGNELQKLKDDFKTLCKNFHIKNNQSYLIENLK